MNFFKILALYNTLANERLYEVCSKLTDEELRQDRRTFFKSIHGTLNHIMVGDRIWLSRFKGEEALSTGLDTIIYESFDILWSERKKQDAAISDFVDQVTVDFLNSTITYVNNANITYQDDNSMLLMHLFNHQTHHRGQVHAMLTQTKTTPPILDMHRVINP